MDRKFKLTIEAAKLAFEERSKRPILFLKKLDIKKTTKKTCQNFKITISMEKNVLVSNLAEGSLDLIL